MKLYAQIVSCNVVKKTASLRRRFKISIMPSSKKPKLFIGQRTVHSNRTVSADIRYRWLSTHLLMHFDCPIANAC